MSVSLGLGFFSRSAVADMICPDWQYPHCTTSRSTHAFCTAFAARDDKPSIVVTWRLATAETGAEHERNGWPSTWTVQAPHCAMPQPYLVPVRPIFSRIAQSTGASGSTSTSIVLPLIVRFAIAIPLFLVQSIEIALGGMLDRKMEQFKS